MNRNEYTLDGLARETGFSKRQIRFYITKRLVSGAGDMGPNAGYGEDTLRRLRLIAAMKDIPIAPTGRTMTLDEIGHAMDTLPEEGIASLLEGRAELALIDTDDPQSRLSTERHPLPRRAMRSQPVAPPDSAREFLARMRGDSLRSVECARASEPPLDHGLMFSRSLDSGTSNMVSEQSGGEHHDLIVDLLGRLQATLAELGSDTRFTNTAKEGEQWLRIRTPDVEFHVRQPDDHRARQRLIQMAQELGRMLAREE